MLSTYHALFPVLDAGDLMVSQKYKVSFYHQNLQCRGGGDVAQIIPLMNVDYTQIEAMGEWTWCYAYVH